MTHYKQKIEEYPNWELSKKYSDAGISDIGTEKIGYKEMIRDILANKFDLAITKSIM